MSDLEHRLAGIERQLTEISRTLLATGERVAHLEARVSATEAAIIKLVASAMWQAKGQGEP